MKYTGRIIALAVRAVFFAAFLSGCASYDLAVSQGNYLTFQYPFTDATAEEVRRKAVELCEFRKKAVIRSEHVCNLSSCTTTYQCVDKGDAPVLRK